MPVLYYSPTAATTFNTTASSITGGSGTITIVTNPSTNRPAWYWFGPNATIPLYPTTICSSGWTNGTLVTQPNSGFTYYPLLTAPMQTGPGLTRLERIEQERIRHEESVALEAQFCGRRDAALAAGRLALGRSLSLYRAVRGRSELAKFLAGETIVVRGHICDYAITKTQDLLEHTLHPTQCHIPYHLAARDRRTGRHLALGCVVIRETPVMDQIIAVLSHLHDVDDELHLLRTTNWTPSREVNAAMASFGATLAAD